MRRGRPTDPYKAALAALKADVAGWQRQIVATEALIADLTVRADGGTRGTVQGSVHDVPPKVKRRRRRRHGARNGASVPPRKSGTVPRRNAQVRRRKRPKPDVIEPVQVAAQLKAAGKIRGQDKFADQLAELERLKVTIDADGDTEAVHTLSARGNAILVELDGRAKLPAWCTKAVRMRWKRAAAGTTPKQKKLKAPRKVTPPPAPPVKHDSGWRLDENGVRSREVVTT